MSAVAWFKDVGIADRPTVGGKGGSLGELTQAGIAVPPGFVVTTSAFETFLEAIEAR
ncbi:MAG: PEP/pyruvate-binding domain-containing protein, partial [Croceibacterium sp.]